MAKKLTPKQAAFVREYLVDMNATQAAIRAGYSAKTAYSAGQRLLKHVEVARAVAEAQGDRVERTEVTQDYVLENLTETVERCMQRAPVMVRRGRNVVQLQDADGRNVWQFDARGAVQALNLLGKHLAMFSENVNLRTPDGPIEVAVTRKVIGSHNRVAAYTNGNGANGKP